MTPTPSWAVSSVVSASGCSRVWPRRWRVSSSRRSTPISPASGPPERCPRPRSFLLERQGHRSRMPDRRRLAARPSRAGTSSMGRWRAPPSLSPAWPWASLPGGDDVRAFTAAAVQTAPVTGPLSPDVVKTNIKKCVDWLTRCVEATGAELVVLPETATTGFTPGCSPEELWDLVSELPGPVIAPIQAAAAALGVHVCVGTYERGQERGVVY